MHMQGHLDLTCLPLLYQRHGMCWESPYHCWLYIVPADLLILCVSWVFFNVTCSNIVMINFTVSSLKSVQFLIRQKAIPSSLCHRSAALTPLHMELTLVISNLLFPLHCMCVQDLDKHFLKNVWIVVVNKTLFILNGQSLLSFMLPITLYNLQNNV